MSSLKLSEGFGFCAHIFHFQPLLVSRFPPQSACDYVSVSPSVCLSVSPISVKAALPLSVFAWSVLLPGSPRLRGDRAARCLAYLTTPEAAQRLPGSTLLAYDLQSDIHLPVSDICCTSESPLCSSTWDLLLVEGFSMQGREAHLYAVHILKPLDLLFELRFWIIKTFDLNWARITETRPNQTITQQSLQYIVLKPSCSYTISPSAVMFNMCPDDLYIFVFPVRRESTAVKYCLIKTNKKKNQTPLQLLWMLMIYSASKDFI